MKSTTTRTLALCLGMLALAACGGHGGEDKAEEGGGGSAQTVSVVTATTQNLPRTVTAFCRSRRWRTRCTPRGVEGARPLSPTFCG